LFPLLLWLSFSEHGLADGVEEEDGKYEEEGEDDEGKLEVLLKLTPEYDGIKATLLEAGGTVLAVMMVMMMVMFVSHSYFRML
jgi:hypothetical protein